MSEKKKVVIRPLEELEAEMIKITDKYLIAVTTYDYQVREKGKTHKDSDAPKYRAAGNGIALPFWEWLMIRIGNQLRKDGVENPTMASLFDGTGSFPLVAQRNGIKPIWCSEIEPFCVALTKLRFPENEENARTDP